MEGEKRRGAHHHPLLLGGRKEKGEGGGYTHGLSASQMRSLSAMCEAFIPSLGEENHCSRSSNGREDPPGKPLRAFLQASASDHPLPDEVADLVVRRAAPKGVVLFRWAMRLLGSRVGTLLLCGSLCLSRSFPFVHGFADMALERRVKVLQGWSREKFWTPLRMLFFIVKVFCLYVFFTLTDENMQNPSWEAIGYTNPNNDDKEQRHHVEKEEEDKSTPPISKKRPLDDGIIETIYETDASLLRSVTLKGLVVSDSPAALTVHCDVVVIGSGCGGGVAAAVLASSGYKVVVLEKGNYFTAGDYPTLEGPAMGELYEGGGFVCSADGKIMLLAGSTVGGGSAINWSACIRTPDQVMKEWSEGSRLPLFGSPEYTSAMDVVWRRIGVTDRCDREGLQNRILRRGCETLGVNVHSVARNSGEGHFCGHCGYGCKTGSKKGTDTTWLVDAVEAGAVILTGCQAERLLIEAIAGGGSRRSKRCTGVTARSTGNGVRKRIELRAKATIVACGSLRTPPLLLSSGLGNKNIGKNLRLHPVMLVWGYFPESAADVGDVKDRCFDGGIITSLHKVMDSDDPSEAKCRAIIETPLLGPGSFASLLPWVSGQDFKERMARYSRTANLFALVRDRGSGSVDSGGVIRYKMDGRDRENLRAGARAALRILIAAGAAEVGTYRSDGQRVRCGGALKETEVEEFLEEVTTAGGPASRGEVWSIYCSAHQMGSCRMGASEEEGAVDGGGESWEAEGLFVCDGSVLPGAVGVNPMITIEATAYCIATGVAGLLKD